MTTTSRSARPRPSIRSPRSRLSRPGRPAGSRRWPLAAALLLAAGAALGQATPPAAPDQPLAPGKERCYGLQKPVDVPNMTAEANIKRKPSDADQGEAPVIVTAGECAKLGGSTRPKGKEGGG